MAKSAYIHIPFCAHKCDFCDFAAFAGLDDLSDQYTKTVISEIEGRLKEQPNNHKLQTVFFGGGTPGYVDPKQLGAIIASLDNVTGLEKDAELCLETTPQTITVEKCKQWQSFGIKRISIGIESLNDKELIALSRGHTREQARAGFATARAGGFTNIALDLMYGLPEQTLESWRQTLDDLLALEPEHISAYGLTIAENSPLLIRYPRESDVYPDEDTFVLMYETLVQKCSDAGLFQYEIANFAKAGYESKHNLTYWKNEEYLAFGVSAHRYYRGTRSSNFRSLRRYMRDYLLDETSESIDEQTKMKEAIFLGMRLRQGLDLKIFQRDFGVDLTQSRARELEKLQDGGFVEIADQNLRLTQKGVLMSNSVLSELI
jgi:oxygen-independent coproporphyrinogen-3 oxidase